MSFTTVNSDEFYEFNKAGDSIEGCLLNIENVTVRSQSVPVSTIKTKDGIKKIWLGAKLKSILPKLVNKYVRITYIGKKPTKNGQMKDFQVEVDESHQCKDDDDNTPIEDLFNK